MLEEVRELGVVRNLTKGRCHVAEADVVAQTGHEAEDEVNGVGIFARHNRRARGELDRGNEGARPDGDLLEIEQLSHARLPLCRGPCPGLPSPHCS